MTLILADALGHLHQFLKLDRHLIKRRLTPVRLSKSDGRQWNNRFLLCPGGTSGNSESDSSLEQQYLIPESRKGRLKCHIGNGSSAVPYWTSKSQTSAPSSELLTFTHISIKRQKPKNKRP